jgi:beta-galactosidase
MEKQYVHNAFLYGVVYYPEQWPEAKWHSDLSSIADTGMNVVRMGEGAWSFWEPEEGLYNFSLFDRALEVCQKYKLKAIMGTPTYAPPAWLTERYPEVLRVSFDGRRLTHGSRRHYNYTSLIYWKKTEGIVTALAEHYKAHPAVIGWQIDNEFNCHVDVSFAESDHQAFRSWCKDRYGSLQKLNQAWGTAFWSQTYTEWEEIWLPRPTATYQNPTLLLDFYRFNSDVTIRFAAMQYRLLKSIAPNHFVTHNAFQSMTNVDLPKFTREAVDFLSYDSYPEFKVSNAALPNDFRDRSEGRQLCKMRGASRKFVVLEQQSGPSGQIGGLLNGNPDYLHPTPKPGQMRLWCWNSIAHGADGLLYFRWRSLPYGSESHWNGLLYHDERITWRLKEAERLGEEVIRLAPILLGTNCVSQAAILYDFDNESHAKIETFTGRHRDASELAVYQTLAEKHLLTDLRSLSGISDVRDLVQYKIVFFPHAHILTASQVEVLSDYVEAGGTLVFGCWSGYRDKNHWCYDATGRAFYESLVGTRIVDFTIVPPGETSEIRFGDSAIHVEAPIFNEVLAAESENLSVLASYASSYYAGEPAVTLLHKDKGRVIHFGSFFTRRNASALLDILDIHDPIQAWVEAPAAVDVIMRSNGAEHCCFLLNFTDQPQQVRFKQPALDLLESRKLQGHEEIPAYGVYFVRHESQERDASKPAT